MISSLGIKSTLIMDGRNPINLFSTAKGIFIFYPFLHPFVFLIVLFMMKKPFSSGMIPTGNQADEF